MRLADLQAWYTTPPDDNDMTERAIRPATVADLIAALKEEGAVVHECSEITGYYGELIAHPGRYLVYRIDDGPNTSDR